MATLEELVVSLVAETSGLRAEMDKATKATQQATDKMDQAIEEFSKNSSKNVGFFESAMATMAGMLGSELILGAFEKLKEAVGFFSEQLSKGIEDANREEDALTRLANSLQLSGQYSKEAQDKLKDFTQQMEAQTGVADDVVASNLAVLSSLTKLKADGLMSAEKAAIDLSVAMGMDLNSATMLIGKGINGNVESFKRYGIEVQQGATKSENLANILKALANTNGAAAGAMETFDGQVKKAAQSYGNLVEAIATSITQNPVIIATLKAINDELVILTGKAEDGGPALKEGIGLGVVIVSNAMAEAAQVGALLSEVWAVLESVVEGLALPIVAVGEALMALVNIKDSILNGFSDMGKTFEATTAIFNRMDKNLTEDSGLWEVGDKLDGIAQKAANAFAAMGEGAAKTIAPTVGAGKAVDELSAAQANYNRLIVEQAKTLADQGSALDNLYTSQLDMLKAVLDTKLITEADYWSERADLLTTQQATEQAQLDQAYALKKISDQQYNDAKTALLRKQAIDTQKFQADTLAFEQTTSKTRLANMQSTLGTISTLSESSNKELAAIGKAAAISQATIDGFVAVQKALASAPPPFNFALAALVGVATAANIAKISGVSLNSGGTVPGAIGANKDSVMIHGTPGEEVVDRSTSEKLRAFLDGQGQGGAVKIELSLKDGLIEMIEAKILERQRIGVSLLGS